MDIEKLTKDVILQNMTPEQQKAVLDSVMVSVQESKKARTQKVAENVDLVMQALKKIEAKMLDRVSQAADKVETVASNVKDGKDGRDGKDGKDGKQGIQGPKGADGRNGTDGKDGKDGRDGVDGVSVVDAFLDFDNSLVIDLSNGKQINVGAVLSDQTAEKVQIVANGGAAQPLLDAIAALQTEIANLIPDQTGNAGKFLTTNGSVLSWAGGGGGLVYQGTWNASSNSPALVSSTGTNGYYYVVGTSGSTTLDGISDWVLGDWVIFNGTTWQKIDNTDLVTSVAGRTGAITLSNSDVSGSAASGANSDITSMSGITGAISTVDYVGFDTSYATTLGVGQLGWDGNNNLGLGMYGGNVIQKIGEDTFFYVKASSAITKGQVCMFTGAVGASGVVTAAPATGVTDGQYIMGIAAESMALNGFGLVQCFGTLKNVNTTGFTDGDIVYYDSGVTGGFTKTFPSSGPIVTVAAVVNGGSSGSGILQIRITNTQRITASTGISVSQNGTGTTITNSAPDQTVSLTGSGTTTVTGTYPNFTVSSSDAYTGTVTSVGGTGTVSGLSLSGTVTGSGNLTLGGSLDLSSPPTVGNTTPNTGKFTTLESTSIGKIGSSVAQGSPNATDITATAHTLLSGTGGNYLAFGQYASETNYAQWIQSSYQNPTTATYNLILNPLGGNVGIGTSSPAKKLHVSGSTNTLIEVSDTTGTINSYFGQYNGIGYVGMGTNHALGFYTNDTERARIDSSGNVGIGTSSPSVKLDIVGATTSGLRLRSSSGAANGFNIYNDSGTDTAYLMNYYSGPLVFGTSNTERARIDSSGNLLFNSGYGSVATAYGCRAWVNFNGTGTVAIRASGNVTSITDNGTGIYTVNMTNAMPDANYSVSGTAYISTATTTGTVGLRSGMTSSAAPIGTIANGGSDVYADAAVACVEITR